ncbi:hypothetical protein A3F29_02470 [Candidatus Roizmanbacteria bacterium RIFCSPHIGHO2_12_FULL_33_9]|uniref:DUF916 domain-containing protein n=1 Tax=Candidatus Roizmanbacteria bacterium RIFCSPHIGHO2_12_FULL_33_9 TaxID=1802045 RepID=A0A1F7HIK4_9BACT|nr:MAG: hypothetical protein A3F29_02470 [Candidatus Roizmanbacteria bacterium RIFCSPHIGHO2_12_FULL_33_9]
MNKQKNSKSEIRNSRQIQNSNFLNSKIVSCFVLRASNLFFILVLFTSSLLLFTFNSVFAQSVIPLTASPARQEILVDPSEQQTISVRFLNQGDSPISGIIRVADFIVDNKDGIPRILEDSSQASPKYTASTWIKSNSDRITIASKDNVLLQFNIQVPDNARAGGRYVAIFFEPEGVVPQETGANQEAGSGVSTRLASLLYIRVSGEISEQAMISRFFASGFVEFGPIKIETDILNRGDYHIRPKGVLALVNPFGSVVAQETLKEENIFPDTLRTFENELGSKYMLGRYKLTLTASYGEKGQSMSRSIFIWIVPWRIILILILTIIIIWFIIKSLKRKASKNSESLKKELEIEKQEIDRLKKQISKRAD